MEPPSSRSRRPYTKIYTPALRGHFTWETGALSGNLLADFAFDLVDLDWTHVSTGTSNQIHHREGNGYPIRVNSSAISSGTVFGLIAAASLKGRFPVGIPSSQLAIWFHSEPIPIFIRKAVGRMTRPTASLQNIIA